MAEMDATFRLATLSDKPQISENFPWIYNGADYLPELYDYYVNNDHRFYCFVAISEAQIVSKDNTALFILITY